MKTLDHGAESGSARSWVSVHLFSQRSPDRLLAELVTPIVDGLRSSQAISEYFFIRHWQGGPHVRLRLLPADPDTAAAVCADVLRRSRRFFAAHPSTAALDQAGYDRMVTALSAVEPDIEPLPLQPNDSATCFPYRPEYHKYGVPPVLHAVERHFTQSSDLVLEVLRREVPPERRRVLAFAALISGQGEVGSGWRDLAGRLHDGARAWDAVTGLGTESLHARVAQTYRSQREQLREVATLMWDPATPSVPDPFLQGWRDSMYELRGALTALAHPDPAFALENCNHLICNRLGVGLRDEWFLRALAAHVAADLLDTTTRFYTAAGKELP